MFEQREVDLIQMFHVLAVVDFTLRPLIIDFSIVCPFSFESSFELQKVSVDCAQSFYSPKRPSSLESHNLCRSTYTFVHGQVLSET